MKLKHLIGLLLVTVSATAQLKLGNNGTTRNINSILEMEHTTKGMLLPRVSLTSTTSYSPLTSAIVAGFVVYNSNASVTAGSSSYPINSGGTGLYYWDGSGWVAVKAVDAYARANHTGTQTASTISDFDTEVANNSAVAANTAKVTNATHTGDVTGSTTLSIAPGVIVDADVNASAAIDATKIANGTVTNTEFQYIGGLTSDAQTQINAKGSGTVTSVGGTGTVSGLSLSGTVTGSGNLTLGGTLSVAPSNFSSQTANTFLAAPNGAPGTPTFRAMVAADLPSSIDATKIANGTVTSTEFQYIGGLTSDAQTQINAKQATLVSGTNIKTINSNSLLGSGNIAISAGPTPIIGATSAVTGTTSGNIISVTIPGGTLSTTQPLTAKAWGAITGSSGSISFSSTLGGTTITSGAYTSYTSNANNWYFFVEIELTAISNTSVNAGLKVLLSDNSGTVRDTGIRTNGAVTVSDISSNRTFTITVALGNVSTNVNAGRYTIR